MTCKCTFTVNVPDSTIETGQWVGIVGNTSELGAWKPQQCLLLSRRDNKWVGSVHLQTGSMVKYRYMIGVTEHPDQLKIVQKWESHIVDDCRTFVTPDKVDFNKQEDQFGVVNDAKKVEEGWLSIQSEIRLQISSNLFSASQHIKDSLSRLFVKPIVHPMPMSLKVNSISPLHFSQLTEVPVDGIPIPADENLCVSVIIETCRPDKTQVILEFMDPTTNATMGKSTVTSDMLAKSKGILCNTLIDMSGKAIANIQLPYLTIHPHKTISMTMEECYLRHWSHKTCVHTGHRGSGNSYTSEKIADVRENSIASFNKAAENGAMYVEFDVLLSKDKVPVVYHDFSACIPTEKKDGTASLMDVRVSDLNLDELQTFKMRHESRKASPLRKLEFDENDSSGESQPFPTLRDVFKNVLPSVGFNVEVKWPTLDMKGAYEGGMPSSFDANEYIDIILETVFDCALTRPIIFSCFDVDICIMLRRKQNKYPVLFLTNGDTMHYTPMMDLRERTNYMAIGTALSEGFLGLNSLEKDVYELPETITKCHEGNLLFVCYGDGCTDNLQLMHDCSVDMVIYDRISAKDYGVF